LAGWLVASDVIVVLSSLFKKKIFWLNLESLQVGTFRLNLAKLLVDDCHLQVGTFRLNLAKLHYHG
jgi:hypothetical protein